MQIPDPRQMPNFQPRGFHPPVSNAERQREFRERNPTYYRDLQRRRRASIAADSRLLVAKLAMKSATDALMKQALLLLPAPVLTLEIPGVNAIPTREQFAVMQAERAAA